MRKAVSEHVSWEPVVCFHTEYVSHRADKEITGLKTPPGAEYILRVRSVKLAKAMDISEVKAEGF